MGYQGTLELLYFLAPELRSHAFIKINDISRHIGRFLAFWIMAELTQYSKTEGKVGEMIPYASIAIERTKKTIPKTFIN